MNKFFNKEIISQEFLNNLYKESVTPDRFELDIPFLGLNISEIKVVIIAEHPYKNSNGLAFSTHGKLNNTVKNIFLELKNCTGIENDNGDLTPWKYENILLFNATPVLNKNNPNPYFYESKFKLITQKIISELSKQCNYVIFVMWGNKIQKYSNLIDNSHFILSSSHPSPHFANVSFFGNEHFLRINEILLKLKKPLINWKT